MSIRRSVCSLSRAVGRGRIVALRMWPIAGKWTSSRTASRFVTSHSWRPLEKVINRSLLERHMVNQQVWLLTLDRVRTGHVLHARQHG